MKFNVSSTLLCNRLLTLSRVLASKNSLQILDCILFELEDDTLIPASEELITHIDQEKKQVTIALPEGILNL